MIVVPCQDPRHSSLQVCRSRQQRYGGRVLISFCRPFSGMGLHMGNLLYSLYHVLFVGAPVSSALGSNHVIHGKGEDDRDKYDEESINEENDGNEEDLDGSKECYCDEVEDDDEL
ncbi:hypothetical protein CDL15_Pgr028592 [Punica granatum]|uniref:Uncharacterized protein n=1 Tax=Punica granatum TaxID=22663 RepID=A0A218VWL7_PUNGR|nr:hypothetical protein CDL15_Pgr028592 [Punica granatum]